MSEYKKYFYEVTKYLEDNFGINVVLSYDTDGDYWFPALRKILINKNNQWRERYFSLIHESGHARLDMESLSIKSLKIVQNFIFFEQENLIPLCTLSCVLRELGAPVM